MQDILKHLFTRIEYEQEGGDSIAEEYNCTSAQVHQVIWFESQAPGTGSVSTLLKHKQN